MSSVDVLVDVLFMSISISTSQPSTLAKPKGAFEKYMRHCSHREHELVIMAFNQIPGRHSSALFVDLNLLRDLSKPANYFLISSGKPIDNIWYSHFLTKLDHHRLCLPQIMSRDSWKEVMHSLKLQPTMEEVEPLRAINIHCGPEHLLGKRLVYAEVRCAHCEMAQCELDM